MGNNLNLCRSSTPSSNLSSKAESIHMKKRKHTNSSLESPAKDDFWKIASGARKILSRKILRLSIAFRIGLIFVTCKPRNCALSFLHEPGVTVWFSKFSICYTM